MLKMVRSKLRRSFEPVNSEHSLKRQVNRSPNGLVAPEKENVDTCSTHLKPSNNLQVPLAACIWDAAWYGCVTPCPYLKDGNASPTK